MLGVVRNVSKSQNQILIGWAPLYPPPKQQDQSDDLGSVCDADFDI